MGPTSCCSTAEKKCDVVREEATQVGRGATGALVVVERRVGALGMGIVAAAHVHVAGATREARGVFVGERRDAYVLEEVVARPLLQRDVEAAELAGEVDGTVEHQQE